MPSEEAGEPMSIGLSADLTAWLQRRATERGVDVETYARELLLAQRAVDLGEIDLEEGLGGPLGVVGLDDEGGEVVRRDEHDADVEELRSHVDELVEDVRNRVIQIKRETDGKASSVHDHPELAGDIENLGREVESLLDAIAAHESSIESLRHDLDGGFENFSEVLEYLVETTDDLIDRSDRLARATIALRNRTQELAASVVERERVDQLKRDAAQDGITAADCEGCSRTIQLGLLTEPRCPACATDFVAVEPKRGIFGSPTLATGDRPALESGDLDAVTGDLESAFESDRPHPGTVDWERTGDDS